MQLKMVIKISTDDIKLFCVNGLIQCSIKK